MKKKYNPVNVLLFHQTYEWSWVVGIFYHHGWIESSEFGLKWQFGRLLHSRLKNPILHFFKKLPHILVALWDLLLFVFFFSFFLYLQYGVIESWGIFHECICNMGQSSFWLVCFGDYFDVWLSRSIGFCIAACMQTSNIKGFNYTG
jgi:hypothetical protein